MPVERKIDEDTLGVMLDEQIISKEKLLQDLDRHQRNLQTYEAEYLERKEELEGHIEITQARITLLEK